MAQANRILLPSPDRDDARRLHLITYDAQDDLRAVTGLTRMGVPKTDELRPGLIWTAGELLSIGRRLDRVCGRLFVLSVAILLVFRIPRDSFGLDFYGYVSYPIVIIYNH